MKFSLYEKGRLWRISLNLRVRVNILKVTRYWTDFGEETNFLEAWLKQVIIAKRNRELGRKPDYLPSTGFSPEI